MLISLMTLVESLIHSKLARGGLDKESKMLILLMTPESLIHSKLARGLDIKSTYLLQLFSFFFFLNVNMMIGQSCVTSNSVF